MKSSLVPFLILSTAACQAGAAEPLKYNRDVRPILSDACFACHGPDKNHREADLRLDVREAAISAGAIVPGQPGKSSVLERMLSHDEDDLMPPPESKKTLTAAQKKTIEEWIRQGAVYEPHWAYTPLTRPTVPPAGQGNAASSAIDAFVQKALAEKNITPSDLADARTLVRRLSLDLTGLPPTPAEAAAFEKDFGKDASSALAKLAERLMKSPHFGERWAAWWLDVARFSDTVGFHGDQNQRIFPYRDYVINAFNSNKRFDQFTLEQLAGDLLPHPTEEQLVATGFNRLNMMTREGGAQPKEYLAKYQADRVRTVGGAWLGATLGCAECHDHKFDPYTAHDFYAMSAYFGDVKQFGVYSSYGYSPVEELKGWTNDYPFPPEILVGSPYLKQRLKKLTAQMEQTAVRAVAAAPAGEVEAWRKETRDALQAASPWYRPELEVVTRLAPPAGKKAEAKTQRAKGKEQAKGKQEKKAASDKAPPAESAEESQAVLQADARWLVTGKGAQTTSLVFRARSAARIAAVKLELLPDPAHKGSIEMNGTANGLTLTAALTVRSPVDEKEKAVPVLLADADIKAPRYSGTAEIPGITGGWKTVAGRSTEAHTGVWLLEVPMDLKAGDTFTCRLAGHTAGCLRLSLSAVAPPQPLAREDQWLPALAKALDAKETANPVFAQAWLLQSGRNAEARAAWKALEAQVVECNEGRAWTQVTVPVKEPLVIRRLPRGNWMDETGEVCDPAPPGFLQTSLGKGPATGAKAPATGTRQTRLDLARWLTSAENPLTARTFVNRLWKQFFGNGLSMAVDDLGAQGETPSHPELLDWLAVEFRESGWDVQHVMRLIVTSHTYLQDSRTRPELADIDPGNRLLAFQNPRRLDAEFVRDNALFAAGLLNMDIGGPSVKPYQPGGYYENLQFPSRDYIASNDDRQYRRGVYMHWQRTFLHPMLANFDAPARDECTAARNVSNTPQQALTLLNDPSFVEAARTLAEKLAAGGDDTRMREAFQRVLARDPKKTELESLLTFLKSQRELYASTPSEAQKLLTTGLRPPPAGNATELAAWTQVSRVLLNLHESITRY
ncbi:MAG TPA: DUF1553 domain-containing protein [Prosthecobacter sp.]